MNVDEHGNVIRKDEYTQVVVWPGTLVGQDKIKDFEEFLQKEMGVRVQYLEEIETNATVDEEGSGGRNDVLFGVHREDLGKFAAPRFAYGMRWLEDIYGNGSGYLYPERVAMYRCWKEAPTDPHADEAEA